MSVPGLLKHFTNFVFILSPLLSLYILCIKNMFQEVRKMNCDYNCDFGIVKAVTLPECSSSMSNPKGIDGPLVGKIPVVIAEPTIQVVVEACVDLPEPAFEIKRIKKNLFITQCKLIDLGKFGKGKLFLSGYVRKNIEYATPDKVCKKDNSISGDIKHLTVNVPFTCVSEIYYTVSPKIRYQGISRQASFNQECVSTGCKNDMLIGRMPCDDYYVMNETFNEPVYCELEEADFYENDLHHCKKHCKDDFPGECVFEKITEKLVIQVRLKLIQNQQVNIGDFGKGQAKNKYC